MQYARDVKNDRTKWRRNSIQKTKPAEYLKVIWEGSVIRVLRYVLCTAGKSLQMGGKKIKIERESLLFPMLCIYG